MNQRVSDKTRSILVGIFILAAYGVIASSITESRFLVLFADVISGIAVIGIALLMYPLFRKSSFILSISYLILKVLEGGLMILGGVLFIRSSTQDLRSLIYNDFHIYIFIVSAFLFYFLLYRQKLIPGFICLWGIAGIGALSISTVLKLFDIHITVLDYFLVLIISNEIFLAFWLFVKGLNIRNSRHNL
ncbi:DUF4386 domain-containing protein [Oceanispirochaeta sp.]|jgi:hypothetical protein|uniref:DUF4386 domain-containing protein n=1 Tax=Oceanispirochaeta sp. TaxID=2035350 RepID=UPI00262C1261|nr:DUF4386 domain-containing protein [Oceanispirochaeta sp.]MDA3956870.1 DUF4386 domain-containing protein [Oceanispirochaeta sp.]